MKALLALVLLFALPVSARTFQPTPDVVIGQQYYLYGTMSSAHLVTIIEYRERGEYAFRWDSGPFTGKYALNAIRETLARPQGCAQPGFCVGQKVIVPSRQSATAVIVAIGMSERREMVLQFLDGRFAGSYGGSWQARDLLLAR